MDQEIQMPCALEVEAAALCCIIENPARFTGEAWQAQIVGGFFHDDGHAALWELISSRTRAAKAVDPASLRGAIREIRNGSLSLAKFSEVLLSEYSENAWPDYIETLRDRYARRLAIAAGREVHAAGLDGQTAVDRLRAAAIAATDALAGSSAVLDSKACMKAFRSSLSARYEAGQLPGMSSGITVIDQLTGGLRPGELWVIGAPTSWGKSVFMLQVSVEALKEGKRVIVFTLEMGADEVVGRLLSSGWSISIADILNPRHATKATMAKIEPAMDSLESMPLMVCDSADLSMELIAGHCQRVAETSGLDLVVIDYIQLVSAPRVKGQNREQEVAGISRACKQLAKRLKCPVIAATQLNENGKARESRAIENDADAVFFVIPDKEGEAGDCIFQAWKCRNGKRGETFRVRLNGEHQRFTFY